MLVVPEDCVTNIQPRYGPVTTQREGKWSRSSHLGSLRHRIGKMKKKNFYAICTVMINW